MSTTDKVALAALGVSAIALLMAIVSAFISFKGLRIAEAQESRRIPGLDLTVTDSFALQVDSGDRLFAFLIGVVNRSDGYNAVRGVRLLVEVGLENEARTTYALEHDANLAVQLGRHSGPPLEPPFEMGVGAAVSGFVIFKAAANLLVGSRIDSYTVEVIDTFGGTVSKDAIFVNERRDV